MGGRYITPNETQSLFLAATPYISASILDLDVQHPNWMASLYDMKPWELGAGTSLTQLIFRGGRPQIERGFSAWRKLNNDSGCQPCEGDRCSYNWTEMGGHAFERKVTTLMDRDFRSPKYCIKDIDTTANFDEVFAKIVENLYRQVAYFKEFSIGQNFMAEITKKYVWDGEGPKCNTNNIYVYRNTGGERISTLGVDMLEWFYEELVRTPSAIPYDVIDGAPIFAMECSRQLLSHLYRDDDKLRQDVRFSGLANDLVLKYNFMSTIRGMFIPAPILYPRRFNVVAGEPIEVLPFINGIPGEIGTYTGPNPDYTLARYEEVTLHGRSPFSIFYKPTPTSLAGGAATFGPEQSFMDNWQWVNPSTDCDPARREGFFMTQATIGLSQQWSEGAFAVLVERPNIAAAAIYVPEPVCPPATVTCDNIVPPVDCPCPLVMNIVANPMVADNYFFYFGTAVTGDEGDPIVFQLDNGGTITGELVSLNDDSTVGEVTITGGLVNEGMCSNIVSVLCTSRLVCSSKVNMTSDCRSGTTNTILAILDQPIKAVAVDDQITAYTGNCTEITLEVVSVDMETLTWELRYVDGLPTADDFNCSTCGLARVCVPPETDNTCPACNPTIEPCGAQA